jgi:EmrB/QacA subfamily drug resistance transporter
VTVAPERDRRWWGLGVITVAIFISAMDATIVNVALPDVAHDLDAGLNELQWVIDAFLIALAGLLLVGSGLADRFGRRRVFLAGFSGFAVASLLAAAAATPEQLIGARLLMGAATACILPPALSLISVVFAPEERPRAIAIWAAVSGIGFALGPVVGGLLVDTLGWRWIFLVNVPFAIVAVPAGRRLLPESTRPGTPPLDVVGAVLSILALGGVVFALIEGQARGWGHPAVVGAALLGIAALVAFARAELRRASPLFDVRVLRRPTVRAGAFGLMAIYGSVMGLLFLVPQYLQGVQDRSAMVTGLLLAPLGVAMGLVAPLEPRVAARIGGPERLLPIGLLTLAASFVPLIVLSPGASPLLVALGAGIYGAGLALTVTPATATVLDDLGAERAGDAAAVNQLARQVGGALGVAIAGSLFGALLGPLSTTGATRWALALCAGFALIAAAGAAGVRRPALVARRP